MKTAKETWLAIVIKNLKLHVKIIIAIVVIVIAIFLYTPNYLNTYPNNFPTNIDIVIEEGLSHTEIANRLLKQNVIRSSFFLYLILKNEYENEFVKAGVYNFNRRTTGTGRISFSRYIFCFRKYNFG